MIAVSPLARLRIEWRHAWPVRFAHHPVCARHRHETWRVGRMYLCRGCLSMGLGVVVGLAAALAATGNWLTPTAAVMTPVVLGLSWPAWYPRWPRWSRDWLRFALGFWIVIGVSAVFRAPPYWWPVVLTVPVLWWVFRAARRRVNARRCDGCPELGRGVCSGYAPHAAAMRAIADELESRMVLSGSDFPRP